MTRVALASVCLGLALLTWFQFLGHTWLQQDSQIYVAILEHQRDPSVLRNDILVQQAPLAFTVYDPVTVLFQRVTGLSFQVVLAVAQVIARAFGIWGLYLMATAIGFRAGLALLVAGICSLGATIAGPAVLTVEYEPTPRAIALPLVMCGIGLTAHRRYGTAGVAGAVALLVHGPTALPFWVVFGVLAIRRRPAALIPFAAAMGILLLGARGQTAQAFWGQLTPLQEQVQRLRASYIWVSLWRPEVIAHHLVLFGIGVAAFLRIRDKIPADLRAFLIAVPVLGVLSMPVSWLLLECWRWVLIPQLQPMRTLLFVALAMQFLTAAAGVRAAQQRRFAEATIWFALAFLVPLQPLFTAGFGWRSVLIAAILAGIATQLRFAPMAAVVAFVAIPVLGGVVNYPRLHTPELAQVSEWARTATPRDSVFLFPDAGHGLEPGIFRAEALRAVYVDWKGGGQVNYLKDFAAEWWTRWQLTMVQPFRPEALPSYEAMGIGYIVVPLKDRLNRPAEFENGGYLVYATRGAGRP